MNPINNFKDIHNIIDISPAKFTSFYSVKGQPRYVSQVIDIRGVIDDEKKSKTILCEYISYNDDVNPYFDADFKIPYKEDNHQSEIDFKENKLKNECINMINTIFESYKGKYTIKEGKKNKRVLFENGKNPTIYKLSLRFWVKGIKIKPNYLKMLLDQYQPVNNSPFDNSVYNDGRVMIFPEFSKPKSTIDPSQTKLLPLDEKYDIKDFIITNVKKDDYDLNKDVRSIIQKLVDNSEKSVNSIQEYVESVNILFNPEKVIGECKEYVNSFSKETADDYNKWYIIGSALKNTGSKYLFENKAFEMFKFFSKKSDKYSEDDMLNFWNKGAGLPKLKEMYLNDIKNADNDELIKTQGYEVIKKEFEKNVCKIMSDCTFIRIKNNVLYMLKQDVLCKIFANYYCYIQKDNKVQKTQFITLWLHDENMRTYDDIVFDPSRTCSDTHYNLFTGFRAERLPPIPDDEVDILIQPILRHYEEVLYGKDWEYGVDLDKQIIQNPENKSGIIVVLKGPQGIGKTIIIEEVLRARIIGEEWASQCGGIAPLFERFETNTPKKLLCLCDEVSISEMMNNKTLNEKVKNLATGRTIDWEIKGITKINLINFINLRFTSNNETPVCIPPDDRRFCPFECIETHKGDKKYIDQLVKACTDDRVARAY